MLLAFFSQVCKLALVGRVLREAFRANFSGSGGKALTAFTHSKCRGVRGYGQACPSL